MQMKKISLKSMMFAILGFVLVACLAITLPLTMSSEQVAETNADYGFSVTFNGFGDNANKFCVATLIKSDGSMSTQVLKANGNVSLSGAGKLELTIPMYSKISTTGLTYTQNGSTYYFDVASSVPNLTITFEEKGYLGGAVVVA